MFIDGLPADADAAGEAPAIAVLGAGLTGLSTAWHAERAGLRPWLFERDARPGGLCRTDWHDGFGFDHSIHILYTQDDYARRLICDTWLAGGLAEQTRRSFCYSAGVYTEYPYQHHTFGLPPGIVEENVIGIIEARQRDGDPPPADFEQWIRRTFGEGIARHFMLPYNRKNWAWDLAQMHYGWIADRVPTPTVREVLRGALRPPTGRVGPNARFWYPRQGGIEALPRAIAADVHCPILCGSTVTRVETSPLVVHWEHQRQPYRRRFDRVVSTLPITAIVRLLDDVPADVAEAAGRLAHNAVHTVCMGFRGFASPEYHWIYVPEDEFVFHRISFPDRFAESMAPAGAGSILAEVSESAHRPIDRSTLVRDVLDGLRRMGVVPPDREPDVVRVKTLEPAYVIYTHDHRDCVDRVRTFLEARDIFSAGRFGEWEYYNMDHAILSGRRAAEWAGSAALINAADSSSRRDTTHASV